MTDKVASIAKVCHEVNRAYCLALGDTSQVPWEDAPDWQRNSAMHGVEEIMENPDLPASSSHEGWLKEKYDTGWKYGRVKNADTKEHPCCVPFEELPADQKAKDYIFGAVARELLAIA